MAEYVLGTHDAELERLGFQARLWADAAHAAWKRARIMRGQRVLDLGCGPGFASADLAVLVGGEGRVVGLDESAGFVEAANGRGIPSLRAVVGDVQRASAFLAGEAPFDLAYARWLLCFVPEPEAVVAEAARMLRPGGRLVVHDYFNYTAMTAAPRREVWTEVVLATARSWRARGGDPDVCGRLPAMLSRHGFEMEHVEVHQRFGFPGDTMFQWASTWWRNYAPRLAEMGEITAEVRDQFLAALADIERSGDQFIVMPPVWEFIARKR